VLDKPQLPRPVGVVKGKTWADIWSGIATLSKQNQNLVQYLQNFLTQTYNWLVPAKYNISVVVSPYNANATDAFIAASAGAVTLPMSSGGGRVIIVKNIDTSGGAVVITAQGTDTIDGNSTVSITIQNDTVRVIDGAVGQWMIW